jgi:hypothetical protein
MGMSPPITNPIGHTNDLQHRDGTGESKRTQINQEKSRIRKRKEIGS